MSLYCICGAYASTAALLCTLARFKVEEPRETREIKSRDTVLWLPGSFIRETCV